MLIKKAAMLFGIVFIVVGCLGFVPAVAPGGMLLGLFHVNPAHNAVHLLSGIVALACAFSGVAASRLYFKIFGVVYALVAVLGLVQGDTLLLGLIANNMHDVWLHFLIAAAALYLGFAYKETAAA
jgi:hypothetical protein